MAQDIRKLFKEEPKVSSHKMPKGHEARFLDKLDEALPKQTSRPLFSFLNIAASVVILIGLSLGGYTYFNQSVPEVIPETIANKSPLGEISPELKKVEDYYLANINLELSKMEVTPDNKEMFDGYLERLEELNNEYAVLADELTTSGPTERTVNALIDNLKLRLNLLYRLKEKLNELKNLTNELEETQV
ncbi:MAG: hypothetical protein DA407_02655 [Bacteroidetes bacterium]|nr:MAG: hypothetical protein DA407_02655 [Bacteroidota bacterium]